MNVNLLTREEFDAMPEHMKSLRRALWRDIIRNLEASHDRTYHAPTRRAELRRSA